MSSVLASAAGVGQSFQCRNCARHLTVTRGWQAAYAGVLIAGLVICRWAGYEEHTHMPYLALPPLLALASVVVYRYSRVRIAGHRLIWFSLFNIGILGSLLVAVSYAVSG